LIIRVRITGGLGNQLFKFFHGVNLSDIFKSDFALDTTWYRNSTDSRNLVSERNFDLGYYPKIRELTYVEWRSVRLHKIFGQFLRRCHPSIQFQFRYMVENNQTKFIDSLIPPNYVDGSFENLKCLPDPKVILEYLTPPKDSEWLKSSTLNINSLAPIAIHVRRGDFLNLPNMYNVVKPTYYFNAVKEIQKNFGPRPIHLFSDDPSSAIQFLGKNFQIDHVVSQSVDMRTAEIFELLSRYPYLVGANSTFSWWAGYLGYLRGTSIYCTMPEKFLGDDFLDPSLNLRHAGANIIQ